MITYSLSNRQRKELLVRGQSLQIAIPIGPDEVDPIEFARASLPEDREWIVASECDELMVCASGVVGMPSLLGQIMDCEYSEVLRRRLLPMCVAVVIATLVPPNRRGGPMPIQWPGKAYIDGEEIVRAEKSKE
jgi:hypothetical protein